jgi:hypothetical protein
MVYPQKYKNCSTLYITLFKYRVYPHIRNQSIVKFQYTLVFLIFPSFIFQYASVYNKSEIRHQLHLI